MTPRSISTLLLLGLAFAAPAGAQSAGDALEQGTATLTVPGLDRVMIRENVTFAEGLQADFYYSAQHRDDRPAPAVLLLNSGAGADRLKETDRQISWGKLLGASHMVAVTHDAANARDFGQLVAFINENADRLGIDAGRLAIWSSDQHVRAALRYAGAFDNVRALVAYESSMSAIDSSVPAMLINNAGRSSEQRMATEQGIVSFLQKNLRADVPLTRLQPAQAPAQSRGQVDLASLKSSADQAFQQGQVQEAAKLYGNYLERGGQDGIAMFNLGYCLIATDKPDKALGLFKRTASMGVAVQPSLYNIACCYSKMGRVDEGLGALERAFAAGFNDMNLVRTDTDLTNLRKDPRFARVIGQDSTGRPPVVDPPPPGRPPVVDPPPPPRPPVVDPPPNPQPSGASLNELANDAQAAFQAGNWNKAFPLYRELSQRLPDNGGAAFQLGYTAIQVKRYEAAIEAFKRALANDYQRTTSMYNLACCYALVKRSDEAFRWLDAAVKGGFDRQDLLQNDTDLDNIRSDKRFAKYLKEEF